MRHSIRLVFLTLLFAGLSVAATPTTCATAQSAFDSVRASYRPTSWSEVQAVFGAPLSVEEGKPYPGATRLTYAYSGCQILFTIGTEGKIVNKQINLSAAALLPNGTPTDRPNPSTESLGPYIASLQATAQQLQLQLDRLQGAITQLKERTAGVSTSTAPTAGIVSAPVSAHATPSAPPTSAQNSSPSTTTTLDCAENGSCYGDISAATGNPKTVSVRGYYRKDGTYVRGHYRSHK